MRVMAPRLRARPGALAAAAALACAGVAAYAGGVGMTAIFFGQEVRSPPFLEGRVIADGPGQQFLRETCAERGWAACRWKDSQMLFTDDIIWPDVTWHGLPFLLGAALLPVGLWLRRGIDETPRFREEQAGQTAGLADLGTPFGLMAKAFGFTMLWTISYYVMLTYLPTFTQRHAGLSATAALWCNTAGLVALLLAIPLMGMLSDRIGRKPMLLFCCIAFALLAYPGFRLMLSGISVWEVALLQVGFDLVIATFSGPGPAALAELFPTRSRTTLMSIGYSLAVAVFGGFAPFIAVWLIQRTGTPIASTYYLIAAGLVSAATIATFRETAFERLR